MANSPSNLIKPRHKQGFRPVNGALGHPRREVTLSYIAHLAKVSPMAVSTALRAPSPKLRLAPKTRERICKIARSLNYIPNPAARSLRLHRTRSIGFYINRPDYLSLSTPQIHTLVSTLQERLWASGFRLAFHYFEPGKELGLHDFLQPGRFVDGLLVQGRNLNTQEIALIRASGMPSVSLYEQIKGLHSLTVDEFNAGRQAADHLVQKEYRRIGLIAYPTNVTRWDGRLHGFLKRAAELRIEIPAQARFILPRGNTLATMPSLARAAFRRFLENNGDVQCLYVSSDDICFVVAEEMAARGLLLGRDIKLFGYGDVEGDGYSPWPKPRLTTIRPPIREIAARAAAILTDEVARLHPRHEIFKADIIERESMG